MLDQKPTLPNDASARHLLYPFANPNYVAKNPPLVIERGDGVYVSDSQGKRYLDGQGGLWNVNVGFNRPEIKAAIVAQLDRLSYYSIFGGTANLPSIELAAELCRLTAHEGMTKVFFSSGGSEATETAFKLARQYWRMCGQGGRTKIISLRRAYHGVTLGSLSAGGASGYKEMFEPLLPGFTQVETPFPYRNPFTSDPHRLAEICAELLDREILHQGPNTVAAFIAEPVQGAGGVIVPPPNFWPLVREVCDRHKVLLIADEVVTGFGRLGSMFGCRGWGVKPDMMAFAKGINSGYVPLGATMINARVEDMFSGQDDAQFGAAAFFHGNTYAGHPLACAAALANLRIVEAEDLPGNAAKVGDYFLRRLQELQARHETIGDVRGKGLMLAIELVEERKSRKPFDLAVGFGQRICDICRREGVLVRNLADTFIISPPLTFRIEHVDEMIRALDIAFSEAARSLALARKRH
jgi:adenosylmethionine-8-amino-7-oxononanoate aminotransferase